MNVYRVVSEPLAYQEIIDPEIGGPWGVYHIAELVAAPTRARARYIAWKQDPDYGPSMREMPRMSATLSQRATDCPEGLVSGLDHLWAWGYARPYRETEATLVANYLDHMMRTLFEDQPEEVR